MLLGIFVLFYLVYLFINDIHPKYTTITYHVEVSLFSLIWS